MGARAVGVISATFPFPIQNALRPHLQAVSIATEGPVRFSVKLRRPGATERAEPVDQMRWCQECKCAKMKVLGGLLKPAETVVSSNQNTAGSDCTYLVVRIPHPQL